jgi:hypothetical protein
MIALLARGRDCSEEAGMPLHLIKLCVGCDSIEDLADWQAERLRARRRAGEKKPRLFHRTFQTPKRRAELLDGGSLYWVIKGLVQVRQPLLDIAAGSKEDGTPCCLLILANALVPVRPTPRRAFQGWRYFDPGEAPADLKQSAAHNLIAMPPKLKKQLAELGLL